jgi:hypothetical protein
MEKFKAIRKLYPNIVTMRDDVAYDADGNEVTYDNTAVEAEIAKNAYKDQRASEYPDFKEYLDGIVKGDQAQIDKYIADCQAVKAKYPKG